MNIKQNARHHIYFIAEIGQNHQGDISIAKKMVDSLVGTQVSCIKTAKRDIDTCLTDEQKSMPYLTPHSFGETYYEHRKALELSKDDFIELKEYVEAAGFDFFSSFTDLNSLDFLMNIGVSALKIASSRMADMQLLDAAAATGLPIVISTGMSMMEDVKRVIHTFRDNEKYLLQCTSTYACPDGDLNLNIIKTYHKEFDSMVDGIGFSGHHWGIAPDLAAFLMGAMIIERHYTLERGMKGSDHGASLELSGINYILNYINQIAEALGSYEKKILPSELPAMKRLRGDL